MKLDKRLCEAIVALRPHPAFEHVIQVIREDAAGALQTTARAEGTPLARAQGKYLALTEWLEAFDTARNQIEKFK